MAEDGVCHRAGFPQQEAVSLTMAGNRVAPTAPGLWSSPQLLFSEASAFGRRQLRFCSH